MLTLELTNNELSELLKAVNDQKANIRDKTSKYTVPKLSTIEKNLLMERYKHLDRLHTKALDLVQSEMAIAGGK